VFVIEAGIAFFHPGGADQIGVDFGTGRSGRIGAGAIPAFCQDDIGEVFVAHGMVAKGMVHGPQDLGLTVEVNQTDDLFELIEGVKLGFGQGLDIAASRIPQRE
jgi:hypothetical protein